MDGSDKFDMEDIVPKNFGNDGVKELTRALNDTEIAFRRSARWRLQSKRQDLNQQIYKQMKLRDGAENLLKALRATNDRRIKKVAKMELSNASTQLDRLREELEGINSAFDVYQFDESMEKQVPMVSLGLRETSELKFKLPFMDFIKSHYHEDPDDFENELNEFKKIRMSVSHPSRDEQGCQKLYQYFNQLYFIEKKFFSKKGSMPVYFQWYDALTGLPKVQRSVAFEKASVLFNIGALWSQIATKQDRSTEEGVMIAFYSFQKAAGVFSYTKDNFVNSPSVDMTQDTLEALTELMLVQAQACLWERKMQSHTHKIHDNFEDNMKSGQECAEICQGYNRVFLLMNTGICMDTMPIAWINMAKIMYLYYKALSHHFTAAGLLRCNSSHSEALLFDMMPSLYVPHATLSTNVLGKQAKAHLNTALRNHEEASRAKQVCSYCRKMGSLQKVLTESRNKIMKQLATTEEDIFDDPLSPTPVKAYVQQKAVAVPPDFSDTTVEDLFHRLGPVHIFNADSNLSRTKAITITRKNSSFGFSVIGSAPIIVQCAEEHGASWDAGLQVGDIIIGVDGVDVKWEEHTDVVTVIRDKPESVSLTIKTPHSLKEIASHCNLRVIKSDSSVSTHDKMSISSDGSTSSSLNPSISDGCSNDSEGSNPIKHRRQPIIRYSSDPIVQ